MTRSHSTLAASGLPTDGNRDVRRVAGIGWFDELRPLVMRIAVHVGDVMTTADDIYGDGVNIAARLQEFSEPGGVIFSGIVYDLVRGSLDTEARDLGFLRLKNIERPVRAYALAGARVSATRSRAPRGSRPSIAVLPFVEHGVPGEHSYFSDGVDQLAFVARHGEVERPLHGASQVKSPYREALEAGTRSAEALKCSRISAGFQRLSIDSISAAAVQWSCKYQSPAVKSGADRLRRPQPRDIARRRARYRRPAQLRTIRPAGRLADDARIRSCRVRRKAALHQFAAIRRQLAPDPKRFDQN